MVKKDLVKLSVIGAVLLVIFLPPFAKYQEMRSRNKKMEAEMRALKIEAKRMEDEKHKLETDITYIEKKARDKIGVVRKGEIVLRETTKQ